MLRSYQLGFSVSGTMGFSSPPHPSDCQPGVRLVRRTPQDPPKVEYRVCSQVATNVKGNEAEG